MAKCAVSTIKHISPAMGSQIQCVKLAKLIKIRPNLPQSSLDRYVDFASQIIKRGGVIALPTDTLYGISCSIHELSALSMIYSIKGRDFQKPLAVCLGDIEDISEVAVASCVSERLLRNLLPGPVTILLPRSSNLNAQINVGTRSIGVRIPESQFIRQICRVTGPLALTSANKAGFPNSMRVQDFSELWENLDAIFDQGPIENLHFEATLGSTVIDLCRKKHFSIIRDGCALHQTIKILKEFGLTELS